MPTPKGKPRRRNRKSDAKAKAKAAVEAAETAIAKRPAAAIAKRPAAATPLGKFRLKAAGDLIRRYFVSKMHHRLESAARKAGVPDARVGTMRDEVREKAGEVHDAVHKKRKHG